MTIRSVLVTGGAGYVGAVAVPRLLAAGYRVKVYDLYLYGDEALASVRGTEGLTEVKADIRDTERLARELEGVDAVLHLACISNDPSYELDPVLGKSINCDAFLPLVQAARRAGVQRFILASSSSVYGVKSEPEVTEELPLEPLTDYSRFKALCEEILLKEAGPQMTALVVRPATVCGYSPRLRLDLTVNILTHQAVQEGEIRVFGGAQMRPNLHIGDMAEFYFQSLRWPHETIHRKIYNVGYENHTVREIAEKVQAEIGLDVAIRAIPTDDNRSYRISSAKIGRELGFRAQRTVTQAIRDLKDAFSSGKVPDSLSSPRYYNIKTMQLAGLK